MNHRYIENPMSKPTNLSPQEIRSRFEEMKQLRNQQFLLGTVAITFFGVYAGLFMPKAVNADAPVEVYRWSGVAVLFVLCVLFVWARLLRQIIDVISIWLAESGNSVWDKEYRLYSASHPLLSQSRMIAVIFLVLGLAVPAYFWVVTRLLTVAASGDDWLWVLGTFAAYSVIVLSGCLWPGRSRSKVAYEWNEIWK